MSVICPSWWHNAGMAKTGGPREVERRIYFYRADAGADTSGAPVPLDLSQVLQKVQETPFTAGSARYWDQRGGDAIGLWTAPSSSHDRFVLAAVRRSNLPQSELNGTLTALPLGAGAGLHEPIHIRVFPDNIFGIEFNFYGPRPSRLPLYLRHVVSSSPDFTLEALLRQDTQDQLSHQRELRLLDLQVRPSYAAQIRQAHKGLGNALEEMGKASKAQIVGLTLRPEPHGRTSLGSKMLKGVKKLAKLNDLPENVLKFKAKGVNDLTGRVETINLLEDQLVSTRKVVTLGPKSRAVDPDAAFGAIDMAYDELRPQLLVAAGISVASPHGT